MTMPLQISPPFPDLRAANTMSLPDAAMLYASIGFLVIPLDPGQKIPLAELRGGDHWPS